MESEEDLRSPTSAGRAGRALAVMTASVLAIGIATLGYWQPHLSFVAAGRPTAPSMREPMAFYQLAAVDFVDASTGWVVADLPTRDFAVLHTTNAGVSWTRQLAGPAGDIGEYVRFFGRLDGVLVLLGPQATMFQTKDAGKTWSRTDLQEGGGYVVSADFVDARNGWLLIQTGSSLREAPQQTLYRTSDGGLTWVDLGDPVAAGDGAFRTVFADSQRGWLYSVSSGPYAYTTADGGATWRRVPLPAPTGGWPRATAGSLVPEEFFVAARPTIGPGVVAVVVPIAPPRGRTAEGGTIIGYPPLTIRAFDGGGSVTYFYRTLGDWSPYRYASVLSDAGQVIAPLASGQVELSSLDGGSSWRTADVPSAYGAFGFTDALDWWWIGSGQWAKSSNGGVTWTETRPLGVVAPLPGSLQMLDGNHAWFGAMAGSRPMLQTTADGGYYWMAIGLPPITSP